MEIKASELFAKAYKEAYIKIMQHEKERFTFKGGRGSCKSSFISICIILLILINPNYNALIIRRYGKSLRLSVFEQIKWAIEKLGVKGFSIPKSRTTALPITYTRKNGKQQQIIFAGCDDPEKIKSIKVSNGYIAILWVEEKTELNETDLHNIKLSALRGGDKFYTFESYNPPSASRHWVNQEALTKDKNRLLVHTTYKDVPAEWLGSAFMHDVEHTKKTNKRAYENIFLGITTGTGRNIFENLEIREITEEEINTFDFIYMGIDWGYYPDPFAFGIMSYNASTQTLYIFDELYLYKHGNYEAFTQLKKHLETKGLNISDTRITADSAEPKSVADFKQWGANIRGAIKGVGSLDAGFKWLQGLKKIVIDPERCPKATDEFSLYEYEIDKRSGEILNGYPQGQPDHYLALTRYAMEQVWKHKGE